MKKGTITNWLRKIENGGKVVECGCKTDLNLGQMSIGEGKGAWNSDVRLVKNFTY